MLYLVSTNDFLNGLLTSAIGVAMVFVVLALVIGVIVLLKLLNKMLDKKSLKKAEKDLNVSDNEMPSQVAKISESSDEMENAQLVAVITSAVAMMLQDAVAIQEKKANFVVRSINRIR